MAWLIHPNISSILLMPLLVLLSFKLYFVHPKQQTDVSSFLHYCLGHVFSSMWATLSSQVKDCLSFISSIVWKAFLEVQEKQLSMLSFPATTGGLGTNCQQSIVWCAVYGMWCRWCDSSKLLCLCCWDIVRWCCRVLFVLPRYWRKKISMLKSKSSLV